MSAASLAYCLAKSTSSSDARTPLTTTGFSGIDMSISTISDMPDIFSFAKTIVVVSPYGSPITSP